MCVWLRNARLEASSKHTLHALQLRVAVLELQTLGGFLPPPGPPPASLRVQQHPLPCFRWGAVLVLLGLVPGMLGHSTIPVSALVGRRSWHMLVAASDTSRGKLDKYAVCLECTATPSRCSSTANSWRLLAPAWASTSKPPSAAAPSAAATGEALCLFCLTWLLQGMLCDMLVTVLCDMIVTVLCVCGA
jgi:hypothetical protein